MNYLALILLSLYQKVLSPLLHQLLGVRTACRYSQTCSEYAKHVIQEYGILRGGVLAVRRVLSCSPFGQLPANSLSLTKKVKS